ncbi:MAG: efflux RND transporter permease subunit [Candidatus Omnitrophica bacterium]|nr:efflux RND transporter permease subunit [Candidatus Omnitrophota bacterium]
MTISEVSIKNPVFAWMLMLGLMFFGLLSFKGMGIGQMPDVDFPVLSIDVTWEGAAPEVMESDVVDIIEDAVMSVEGIRDVSSSTRQGAADINIEFELERDIDVALQEVQSKLSAAQRRLPDNIDPPVISKQNPEDQPIMWIGVSTESKSLRELMEYVDIELKDRFKTISGVGEIFLGGFRERNLRVWIDPKKLTAFQLTVEDIMNAIQEGHVEIPAGRLETEQKETTVRAMGEARSIEEFENISITKRGGQPIYKPILLKEVATIKDDLADLRRISRIMGKPAVGIGIRKQRGANTVEVAKEVRKRLEEVKRRLREGYEIGINFDSSRYIEDSVHELNFTLLLSAILTSLVCWLFFGSWSTNLNILLAIPTSILGTFMVLKFAGFTLNTFTLLGLSLAIGIVVDDAIMVLENIVRHREMGKAKVEAASEGARQITFAALAATLAVIAVFLPVAFMEGIIGKFFFQFGVTISAAVAISLLEALTLAPMRCSQFLEVGERKTRFGKHFESGLKQLTIFYRKALIVALRNKRKVLVGATIFFLISLGTLPLIRKEFVPSQDQSTFLIRIQTPIGSSIEFTNERFKRVEEIVMKRPELNRYYAAIGGFGGGEVNTGMMFISLKQPKDRPPDPVKKRRLSQQALMTYFRRELNQIPDVKAVIQDLSMRGFAAQRGFPIEFTVRGPDWSKLVEYSEQIQERMKARDLFQDVDTDYLVGMPEIRVYPDREKAFERGVSIGSIARTISAMIGSERIAKYTKGGKRYDVRIQVTPDKRINPEHIENLFVWNNRGEMVRLGDVIHLKEQSSLLAITRRDRERAIGIFANVGSGKSQAKAIEVAGQIGREILPEGYRIVFSGTSQTFKESFQSLMFALWVGILIAYMILASQFNHIIHPFTVLLALPFSISGALIALLISNQSLNIFSMIGLILLLGIVKKNSILLVEFTNQIREQGASPIDALKEACPLRLRPILMTSISTIAAAIPPALAVGPGAETRIPMAIAVIGGVIVSTLLTLFVVPSAYAFLVPFETKDTAMTAFQKGSSKFLESMKNAVSFSKRQLGKFAGDKKRLNIP